MTQSTRNAIDVALVGGGLANGLIAWRLAELRPDITIRIFEAGEEIGGNHTWSFHETDLSRAELTWLEPFLTYRWRGNTVRFPSRRRKFSTGYYSVSSDRFRELLMERFGDRVVTQTRVSQVGSDHLTLADGTRIEAGAVIDGRGAQQSPHLRLGFQKFLGQEIEFDQPHGVFEPVIMDATVTQDDGYRFVYLLPMTPTRLLIEDTYYADGEALDREAIREKITAYQLRQGWAPGRVIREEDGILPIALSGDIEAFWRDKAGVAASGLNAALFHPTTGYSLPDAVRLADRVATLPDLEAATLFEATRRHSIETWKARGFFRMLNRLLYLAGRPSERYRILQHFYRLPEPVVSRFYGARLTRTDKLRVLTGKPPVSVTSALKVLARGQTQGAVS